jgi:hypothetical protein
VRLAPATPDGSAPADSASVRLLRGDSLLVESPALLNDPLIARHRVVATDLEPDTLYAFSVGEGSAEGWTPWKSVRTGPAGPRDFAFLYVGDPQTGLEGWGRLLHEARRRRPDAAFLLIAGDLVDRGNERTNWDHFFLRAAGTFDTLPVMPCAGNHEYLDRGPDLYRATFALPGNGPPGLDPGLAYAFRYGDAVFVVLDSTSAAYDPRIARLQAEWLDATLSAEKATWKFVLFHHPVYASYAKRPNPALRDVWAPVFDKHQVDLVFQGHDHAYLRTHPMRGGRPVAAGEGGTVYLVAVSGDKYYEQAPSDNAAKGLIRTSTYQTIDVSGRRLLYRAFAADGREVDRVEILKGGPSTRTAFNPQGS